MVFQHSSPDPLYPNTMRKNGFSKPYAGLQILTWLLFLFFIVGYTLLPLIAFTSSSLFSLISNIILSLAVFLGATYGVYNGGLACATDPIDKHLKEHLDRDAKGRTQGSDTKSFCWVCQVHVAKTSKHCRFCSKCCDGFDHHCVYLNTCIGAANYKYFFKSVSGVFFFTAAECVAFIMLVARFFAEEKTGPVRTRIRSVYNCGSEGEFLFIAFSIAFTIILVITVAMIAQLFFFHVMLQRRKISTFDYVVEMARKDQAKEKEEGEARYQTGVIEKKRKELGQSKLCGMCWVGGEQLPKAPTFGEEEKNKKKTGGAAVVDGGIEGEEGIVEMNQVAVRDYEHEEAI